MDIQLALLSKAVLSGELTDVVNARITSDFFTDDRYRRVFEYMLKHWQDYGVVPNENVMHSAFPNMESRLRHRHGLMAWDDYKVIYPRWTWELKRFLADTLVDSIDPDGADDDITDKIQAAALAIICEEYGHFVEDDQCGIPDHRFCLMCDRRMSSIPLGHYKP